MVIRSGNKINVCNNSRINIHDNPMIRLDFWYMKAITLFFFHAADHQYSFLLSDKVSSA